MPEEKKYYVYVHKYASGPKEGQVFYVGKGSGGRISSKAGRNSHWNNIVNKYGLNPEKVMSFRNEVCAFSFERLLISIYGIDNLSNMSTGGVGGATGRRNSEDHKKAVSNFHKGMVRSEETRERISKAALERLADPRNHWHTSERVSTWWNSDGSIFVGTHIEISDKEDMPVGVLKKVQSGSIFSYKGWKVCGVRNYPDRGGVRNNTSNNKVFICTKYGFPGFVGCKSDFCNFYGYDTKKSYSVFAGKTKTMDGWSVNEL